MGTPGGITTYFALPFAEAADILTATRIVLREIMRQRLGPGAPAIRKRLARRFSVDRGDPRVQD